MHQLILPYISLHLRIIIFLCWTIHRKSTHYHINPRDSVNNHAKLDRVMFSWLDMRWKGFIYDLLYIYVHPQPCDRWTVFLRTLPTSKPMFCFWNPKIDHISTYTLTNRSLGQLVGWVETHPGWSIAVNRIYLHSPTKL